MKSLKTNWPNLIADTVFNLHTYFLLVQPLQQPPMGRHKIGCCIEETIKKRKNIK